jgi:hypothetical protein
MFGDLSPLAAMEISSMRRAVLAGGHDDGREGVGTR